MKRILSIFLTVLLLVMLVPSAARAAGTPTVSVSSGEVTPGEKVTLTVSIKNNPGIAAAIFYVYFDTSVFEVNPDSDIKASGSFRTSGGLIGNSIAVAKKNGRYEGDAGKDGVMALWYNSSGMNNTGDGAMMTVSLTAKKSAPNGSYAIGVGYAANDTCNQTGQNVKLKTVSGTVTVTGSTSTKPESPQKPGIDSSVVFTDISGNWAENYILRANAAGLVEGYLGKYRPNDTMTRAEFVTILWRSVGEPKPNAKATFTDLKQDWYKDAVAWAQENDVVNGMGNNKFAPDGTVTREQIVTILHRLAGSPKGMEAMLGGIYDDQFSDSGKIGAWARQAVYWAVYNEIYCGENSVAVSDKLAPGNAANRAQIAVIMVNYLDTQGGNT